MERLDLGALRHCAAEFTAITELQQTVTLLDAVDLSSDQSLASAIKSLEASLPLVEAAIWQTPPDTQQIAHYQQLFQLLERLIALKGNDQRHHFVITIPVADRPQHLRSCLESIEKLCELFLYGGRHSGRYSKLTVVIADDSREAASISEHQALARHFSERGVETIYFGQDEQIAVLTRLSPHDRAALTNIVGAIDPETFFHKGASITRNIAYLKLNELAQQIENPLFYFIDSDQEFKITVETGGSEQPLYAINYLYQLDRIFTETDATILTGKVVGDPPVSPSVMAGNFLEDLIAFLHQLTTIDASSSCHFHQQGQNADEASYHDMAALFGFRPAAESFNYRCTLQGAHDHAACLSDFADKLNRFFDGEHPTRKSYYEYAPLTDSIKPARTIYTGNYIFKPEALEWFIPFATLKLRMAGPTLGRLIKSTLGKKFVSANLPMLHKRTVEDISQSEFRPGIERSEQRVDLSGEFERQFFGDVMLFTVDTLTQSGYPDTPLTRDEIGVQIEQTGKQMQAIYASKHRQIIDHIEQLRSIVTDPAQWWNSDQGLTLSIDKITLFIENIDHNFGSSAEGYRLISDTRHTHQRYKEIQIALTSYEWDRVSWQSALHGTDRV